MKKLLLIGINTRPMVNSALKLNYKVYSASYFSCYDMPKIKNEKHILHEKANKSSGVFEDKFNPNELIELANDYLDEVDYIIPISGIQPSDFSTQEKKKILGNKNTEKVEDKFKFYKEIKNEFNIPKTFNVRDIDEAKEIIESEAIDKYIIKPVQGSGGYGVNLLNNDNYNQLNSDGFILQEFVEGISVSSSVLSSKKESKTIVNSRLLTTKDFNSENSFFYIGNIVPLKTANNELIKEMSETSEKLISKLKLIGSNGVDYILSEKGLYILEVNSRLQGTYECCEQILNINMLEAHIKACQGEIIKTPSKISEYCYKKIIYAPYKLQYKESNLKNLYDLPYPDSIIEENEPFLTIIKKDSDYEKLNQSVDLIDKNIRTLQLNKV